MLAVLVAGVDSKVIHTTSNPQVDVVQQWTPTGYLGRGEGGEEGEEGEGEEGRKEGRKRRKWQRENEGLGIQLSHNEQARLLTIR